MQGIPAEERADLLTALRILTSIYIPDAKPNQRGRAKTCAGKRARLFTLTVDCSWYRDDDPPKQISISKASWML